MIQKKLLAFLICVALSMKDILFVGFSVSASELQQPDLVLEDDIDSESNTQEKSVPEIESTTVENDLLDEAVKQESEVYLEETEPEMQEEESDRKDTEETKIQQESSETEKSTESEIEIETQEQKTEYIEKSESQKKVVKEELSGAYQFGDAPVYCRETSTHSINSEVDTHSLEIEEYLYQQMKEHKENIDVGGYHVYAQKIGEIVSSVLNENPNLYYVNKSFQYSNYEDNTEVTEIMLSYNNLLNDAAFQKAVDMALKVTNSEMSDLEKAIVLHDYLVLNCEYDYENYNNNSIPSVSYTAYGALVNRVAVCQGYALAYKYLLNQAGIDCYMVRSEEMNHAWNLIVLNGKYYQVDVTWDDPVWDRIGTSRHEYMFRSDDAFENKCKHFGWYVTEGNEVVDYKATDTSYDSAFWLDCNSPLVLVGKDCYYVTFNGTGVINKTSLSNITQKGAEVCNIGTWTVWNGSGTWQRAYSGLFYVNGRMYYNDKSSIYSFDIDDMGNAINKREEFKANTTNGYIYGSAFCQGKVLYSLHQSPNLSSKEDVLTADILIETEEPTQIPVEKIELDKKTVTLVIGDKLTLKAVVTPKYATDVITWKSNDGSVAEVSDGTIIAVASGRCEITASAGGKEAICEVIVIDEEDIIAHGSYENIIWKIDTDGKLTVTGTGEFSELPHNMNRAPWDSNREFITSAEINVTDMTNASKIFFGCVNLKNVDLREFDTSQVEDMSYMFTGCENLTRLDVSSFDTKNVTSMWCMFWNCSSLKSIDVSGFDTSNVINMASVFEGCSGLASLDISSFNTQNVKDMNSMFRGCSSLKSIDVSGFDTSNVTAMHRMFENCVSLTNIDISNFDTGNVTAMYNIINGCSSLRTIHTPYNLNLSVTLPVTIGEMWYAPDKSEVTELPQNLSYSIIITKKLTFSDNNIASGNYEDITWVIDNSGKLIVTGTGDFAKPSLNEYDYRNRAPWYDYRTSIIFAEINVTEMTDASYMFYDCKNIKDINLRNLDTSKVTNMSYMFWDCPALENLDISKFNTSKVTNMSGMFGGNSQIRALTSLDVTSFDTSKVTNMNSMFYWCSSVESLDVSGFDTSQVVDMEDMFNGCECLTYLDVSGFNTHKVDNMGRMFYYDRKLMSLDVSNFDTSNVRDMRAMFYECERLTSLDVSGFDTSHVLDMSHMFDGCQSLTSLDVSGFDTSHVLYMEYMFNWCKKLTSLNVRNFNTSIVEDICGIFEGCVNLKELDLSGFDMGAIDEREEDMKDMLSSCIGLATIYTPYNLSYSITLPKDKEADKWYQSDGTVITELPQKLNYSVKIARNSIPVIDNPYIMAQKTKTVYVCGDTLNMEDLTVKYYDVDGTVKEVSGYTTNADTIDMSTAGTKTLIITYNNLTAEIELTVTDALPGLTYTITFDLCGHGVQIAPLTGIAAGSLIMEPQSPVAEGYSFMGWYKDSAYNYVWDFKKDTVQENLTLYAYWMQAEDSTQIGNVLLQRIPAQIYTGSAVKPTVKVYYQSNGMKTLLKAGMDYTVKYYNNIQADTEQEKTLGGTSHTDTGNGFTKDLAYIVITCKGNYTGTVYQNFHINPVSIAEKGFTLSWTEQLISGTKALKPFSSLKYKKVMKAGTDYTIRITAQNAYDANGNALSEGKIIDGNSKFPNIPAGYRGTFLMTITGINNYKGMITKTIYVTDKNHLMKNASVSLGKNLKSIKYTGDLITLTPAWYDISDQKYYIMDENGKSIETDKNNVFTVKLGTEYLVYGKDFKISYQSNLAVGTATMTITGTGDYIGTKNVTFRITGTAFNTHNIRISNLSATLIYTGKALEQNKIVLTDISGIKPNELICGTDYTIHYKNNIKKGTATMILTANPLSGYSGSFKQSFKITAADLSEITNVTAADLYNDTIIAENGNIQFEGKIIYTKEGAKPSGRIVLINRNTNNILQEGTDYKVSYRNNKAITTNSSLAIMIIKGKGNYTGSIIINFPIVKASLSENNNMTVVAASISYNSKKAESYQYQPKIKITDKKKVLSVAKDYEVVEYKNCTQTAVEAYLEALANDAATVGIRPYAIIKARDGSGYEGSIEVNLTIYQTKLTTKNLYIIVSAETEQITYTGKQVRPEVTVYYGKNEAIKQAKAVGETKEYILTDRSGKYKLTKLSSSENGTGDYTLEYGTNIIAGKNKGSVTVNGAGLYGGKVTVKFTILGKNVHNVKRL